jgi:hypothetical protein
MEPIVPTDYSVEVLMFWLMLLAYAIFRCAEWLHEWRARG